MVDVQHYSKTLSNCGITSVSLKYSTFLETWKCKATTAAKKGSCLLTPETVNNILHT